MREPIRIGAEDDPVDVFGMGPPPSAADLHPFPLDERGRALEAARAARFPSAPEVHETGDARAVLAERGVIEDPVPEVGAAPAALATLPLLVAYLDGAAGIETVPLAHPFTHGDREVREIRVPPVDYGTVLDFEAGLVADVFDLVWRVTGEPMVVIRALRGPDAEAVLSAVRAVLPAPIAAALARAERIAELNHLLSE